MLLQTPTTDIYYEITSTIIEQNMDTECGIASSCLQSKANICLQTIFPITYTWKFSDKKTSLEYKKTIEEGQHEMGWPIPRKWGYSGDFWSMSY